jgi:hypothetical protein
MLQIRERVKTLAKQFNGDPQRYVDAVYAADLVNDAVSLIDYGDAEIKQQPDLQWPLLLSILAQRPSTEPARQVASWCRFGVIEISIGIPGGERVAFGSGLFDESIWGATRELAGKNLSAVAPTAETAAAEYRRLLTDPQEGVRGWAALRLADLEPSASALRDCLTSMQSWSDGPVDSGDDWDQSWSQGSGPGWSRWCDLATDALGGKKEDAS